MTGTVRTISRLYLALAASFVLIGTLVIALVAVVQSGNSAQRSASTAECVNDTLADRARATELEQTARYEATVAELRYLQGRGTKTVLIAKKAAYVRAQDLAAAYRAAHPAGRC